MSRASPFAAQLLCAAALLTIAYLLVCHLFPLWITPTSLFTVARLHFALGVTTVIATSFITAPYGKHATGQYYQPMLSARMAWMVQESPTLMAVLYSIYVQVKAQEKRMTVELEFETNWIQDITLWIHPLLSVLSAPLRLFVLHYFHRVFIFPMMLQASNATPFGVALLATIYCSFNGSLQSVATQSAPKVYHPLSIMDLSSSQWPIAVAGLLLFFGGMYVNVKSDYALIDLKRKKVTAKKVPTAGALAERERSGDPEAKESRYSIPTGFFMFDYVSCPNFFGEVVEWFGYALFVTAFATSDYENRLTFYDVLVVPWLALVGLAPPNRSTPSTLAAFSFAFYTAANTIPRGVSHHKWYLATFGERYRQLRRKAVIPFLL